MILNFKFHKSNQARTSTHQKKIEAASNNTKGNDSAFFSSLSANQCSQLMTILQTHLEKTDKSVDNVTHLTGICVLTLSSKTAYDNSQIVDSGASSHICHDKNVFTNLHPAYNIYAILPYHNRYKVEYIGDIHLSNDFCLVDVLYVPQFAYNLMSVSALLKNQRYSINFVSNSCDIQDKSLSTTIGKVDCNDISASTSCFVVSSSNKNIVSTDTWHHRLGHPSLVVYTL